MIRAGRPLHTLACCVLLGVPAALLAAPCEHEVLIARAHELASLLESRAAAGFAIAAVARPDASVQPEHVLLVLTRAVGETRRRVEVAGLTARHLGELEAAVETEARRGFRLRGIARVVDRTEPRSWVALLERPVDAPHGPAASYRLLPSHAAAEEWRRLEAAASEGFAVVDVLWWPDPERSATSEVVFVAERPAGGGAARQLELVWDALEKVVRKLEELAAQGYVADVAWTSRDYLNVLLSRIQGAPLRAGSRFELDWDPGLPAVSSMSGRLVERLAFRDGQVALYDESGRGTYAVEWVAIEPTDLGRQPGASPAEQVLAARLDRHGRSGVCAYDAVFQALPGRPRELLVLLRGEGG